MDLRDGSARRIRTPDEVSNAMNSRTTRSRLSTYASLATTAAASAVGSGVEAAIIVDSTKVNTVIGWNTGAGQTPAVNVTGLGGGGFRLYTMAGNAGSPSGGGKVGVAISWVGAGSGVFRKGGPGPLPAFLAIYGATASAGTASNPFLFVNAAQSNGAVLNNRGNAAFTGASPLTSKYVLFNFVSGGSTRYGWIEILSMTGSSTAGLVSNYSVTLGRWAYEDTGVAITAGQISLTPVPGGSGLVALAFGAAGLRGRRRGRN